MGRAEETGAAENEKSARAAADADADSCSETEKVGCRVPAEHQEQPPPPPSSAAQNDIQCNAGEVADADTAANADTGHEDVVVDPPASCGLVQPVSEHPMLAKVFLLRNACPEPFIKELMELNASLPGDSNSFNMVATRRFFNSEDIAAKLLQAIPAELGFSRLLPDMRFIEYDQGGFILPHKDGVMYDAVTQHSTTTSFLLYLKDAAPGCGETVFLDNLREGEELYACTPSHNSLLLFPHGCPHQGTGAGPEGKLLLRGDLY